jgi:hypothetical protein
LGQRHRVSRDFKLVDWWDSTFTSQRQGFSPLAKDGGLTDDHFSKTLV